MRLSILGLAATSAILWGGGLFVVALLNLAYRDYGYTGFLSSPGYGGAFLDAVSSIYPGFHAPGGSLANAAVGLGYGLVDGFVGGAIFAWLYNRFASPAPASAPTR